MKFKIPLVYSLISEYIIECVSMKDNVLVVMFADLADANVAGYLLQQNIGRGSDNKISSSESHSNYAKTH